MPVEIKNDREAGILAAVRRLTKQDLLVGIPDVNAERKPDPDNEDAEFGNAQIGYVMERGNPAKNIPERPFLVPGVRNARDKIAERFASAARSAVEGNDGEADRQINAAGLTASTSVKKRISSNIPPELKPRTIQGRWDRQASRKGTPYTKEFADSQQTLVDTGQLRQSITYVIRQKGQD